MEILFNAKLYDPLYNCSMYRVDDVPFTQRQNVPFGVSMITLFFIFAPLHLLCMLAMLPFLAHSSAYKVMFLMGFGHIISLFVTSLLTGIFALFGIVFCSAPTLIYFSGSVALFGWSFTTSLSVLLALERCMEQTFTNFAKLCFGRRRILFWCAALLAYAAYYGFFTIPLTFSGITANWQFNPHVGYLDDEAIDANLYWNNVDATHTIIVATLLPALYILFNVLLSLKLAKIKKLPSKTEQKMRKSVFLQVFVLSAVLTAFSVNYTLLNFVPVPDILVSVNMYLWVLLDGVPPLVYLSLNGSLRAECLNLFQPNRVQQLKSVGRTFTVMNTRMIHQ